MQKYSQKSIEYLVLKNIKENGLIFSGQKVIVAVSGGADSVTLLDVLRKISSSEGFSIEVCHYNHRLRGKESDADENFVKKLCDRYSIKCTVGRAKLANLFKNEEEARQARYDFFKKVLKSSGGVRIATAHSANDSAETFLLRIIRGTGVSGLRSISFRRENFIRPLLSITRNQIEKYVESEKLEYVTDATNDDVKYSRNFVRHKIIPLCEEINPNIILTLYNSSRIMEEDLECLNLLVDEAYKNILMEEEKELVLSRSKWLELSPALRRLCLRRAIDAKVGLIDITQTHLKDICKIAEGKAGNKCKILPHSLRVSISSDRIELSVKKIAKENDEKKSK